MGKRGRKRGNRCNNNVSGMEEQSAIASLVQMGLRSSQVVRVACARAGISYPHDGIVTLGVDELPGVPDAELAARVRVIHFCRGDPAAPFDAGAPGVPLSARPPSRGS